MKLLGVCFATCLLRVASWQTRWFQQPIDHRNSAWKHGNTCYCRCMTFDVQWQFELRWPRWECGNLQTVAWPHFNWIMFMLPMDMLLSAQAIPRGGWFRGGMEGWQHSTEIPPFSWSFTMSLSPPCLISKIIHLFTIMSQNKRAQRAYRRAKGRDRHAMLQQLELSSPQAGSRMDVRWRRL